MQPNKPVLVIAQSGRALATSAVKAGIPAYVIDRFNDLDTAGIAAEVRLVKEGTNSAFDHEQLKMTLAEFSHIPFIGVITGSGFESDPELLDWINHRWPIIGNGAETIRLCKRPEIFFPILDELEIQHPEICIEAPDSEGKWLVKETGGSGGSHISEFIQDRKIAGNFYYQKKIDGNNFSAVFIANGKNAVICGISETWCVDPGQGKYTYLGAAGLPDVDENLLDSIHCIINKIVGKLQLKGLCGLDFITDIYGKCYVLEVNPRPTATFELHENTDSLLQAHITACLKQELTEYNKLSEIRAHRIIYADTSLEITDVDWPAWVSDIPTPGRIIRPGSPVCTVHAAGKEPVSVKNQLDNRLKSVTETISHNKLAA